MLRDFFCSENEIFTLILPEFLQKSEIFEGGFGGLDRLFDRDCKRKKGGRSLPYLSADSFVAATF
ncbi:hypothetical protein TH25_03155 [Thalassospira profundimaris]|uniref:Uncharacterized protein n=1 Tax=Thalassospira profundimaris TaxID=502049 RepID=A0A367XL73_9PROT|nr:hypothetical protein TH25_03155 [Thalassospira profundimaris]